MTAPTIAIERLSLPPSDADLHALAALHIDAVDSGAAVSFLAPLPLATAIDWWRHTLTHCHAKAIVLVARQQGRIVGTV